MKMLKRFIVKKNERGLLYSEGDFLAVLEPGTYRRFDPYDRLSLESFSLNTRSLNTAWPATCGRANRNWWSATSPGWTWATTRPACATRTACWWSCSHRAAADCTGKARPSSAWSAST